MVEIQRKPDLDNGYYQNPILGGDYPDPSVLRVGEDYYMTHSSFMYVPGLLIWHSKDLVNWEPVCYALNTFIGDVWAPELIMHNGIYYIYFPAADTNWVVTAPSPQGPWSEPIDLKVGWIDPGHIADDIGNRFLYLSDGRMVRLTDDGIATVGEVEKVYNGWQYPEEWVVEGFCLEGPKLIYKGGYYYMLSAEGGTAGPATSHMVVAARSKSPCGPWENSPYNPIVHTYNREEKWHSKGHGTLIDTPAGDWHMMYHAYEKGYMTLGRQTLLESIEWTEDGWFITSGMKADKPMKMPTGEAVQNSLKLSDSFTNKKLGLQWRSFGGSDLAYYILNDEGLYLKAKGVYAGDARRLTCIPVDPAYEIQMKMKIERGCEAGIMLYYSEKCFCGLGVKDHNSLLYRIAGKAYPTKLPIEMTSDEVYIKMINDHHVLTFYFSEDGIVWHNRGCGVETSGFHHNVFGGFMSLRIALYAAGENGTTFSDFRYTGT